MLFSQTQAGKRYTQQLTRFYASLGYTLVYPLIQESLEAMNVQCKSAPPGPEPNAPLRLRIGGYDQRKQQFKGWATVERFVHKGEEWSFCIMQRDLGSAISWRQLWKALITSPDVEPHVLRK